MAYRVKMKLLNVLWPIKLLKFFLPFFSFTIFGQCFSFLTTVFQCNGNNSFINSSLKCRSGVWFLILGPLSGIAILCQFILALMTNCLYFKPIFINSISDILKKTDSLPDNILLFTKIGLNLIFILDKNNENNFWVILFFSILFTSINAFYTLYYQNRVNNTFKILNNIFSLILLSSFICLIIGKVFEQIEFTGSIFLFFSFIAIIILYVIFYKNKEIKYISIDYKEIINPIDYLNYIFKFYNIIHNNRNTRNYFTVLKSLASKIEETCVIQDCPLKKYIENLNYGIDCPFLLNQFCEKLFEFGISRFNDDICLKINYSIYLISDMNYQKKALMILNRINNNQNISFQNKFFIYRALKLNEKWNFSLINRNNSNYIYRQNIQEFRALIKKLVLLYYDFLSLLGNHSNNSENFNKIHKVGMEIMKNNPKIEEIYRKIVNVQANNLEITKIYCEFIEDILYDEEKIEKYQKNYKKIFSNVIEIHEKDFSNFNMDILNINGSIPYMIISSQKEDFGKIIDISLIALKILGYNEEELKGEHINILIPKLFHKVHDLILLKKNEQYRLKLFDDLNKRKKYFPEFFKKEMYVLSKMKFLIKLNASIFFVKTEENKLVYIFKIENYTPPIFDLIDNSKNISNYCILTDENFIIQTFTPNCLEFLRLKYSQIDSGISIINYIKQFQEDYLIAINDEGISKYTHLNKDEIVTEDKSESSIFKDKIPSFIRKKIKSDLFSKKYSKECKITWRINYDTNINASRIMKKGTLSSRSLKLFREYIKNSISKHLKKEDDYFINQDEKKLSMKIKKIILNEEFLGYYFFFSKGIIKDNNNITFINEKTKSKDKEKNIIKVKKYQYTFINNIKNEKVNVYSSVVLRPQKKDSQGKKEINNNFKKKKSLDKTSKVNFKKMNKKDTSNSYSFISNKKDKALINNLLNEETGDNNSTIITGNYIPENLSHFVIDLKDLSFIQTNVENNQNNYLEILKNEAYEKIREAQNQLKLLSKVTESSYNESEEGESDEYSSDSKTNIESSNIISIEEKDRNNDIKLIPSKMSNKNLTKYASNLSDNNILPNNIINAKKNQRKNSMINNHYKINLNNIHFYIYDFFKEQPIEGNKKLISSKIDNILASLSKNMDPINFEKDEHFSYFNLINSKSKKTVKIKKTEENSSVKTSTSPLINDKINEEKLIRRKLYEALNQNKDERPIRRLKINTIIYYFELIIFGILIIYFDLNYLSKIKDILSGYKYSTLVKYYSQFSVYYLREMTLLNFLYTGLRGGEYTEYPAYDINEYQNLAISELMRLLKESQSSLKKMFSVSLPSSKNSSKILSDYKVNIRLSNSPFLEKKYSIIMSLMHFSSSFNNLASTSVFSPIQQNHPDLYYYIYNNFNGYKYVLNILSELYTNELDRILNKIHLFFIITSILITSFYIVNYILLLNFFLSAMITRGNYMKLFFGIDEDVIKNLINNCEIFVNKLKSSEDQKYIEDQDINETETEEKINIDKNQKNSPSYNSKLNIESDKKNNNKTPKTSIIFIILFGIFNLISFSYFIYNCIFLVNISKTSILIQTFWEKMQNFHITLIEFYNVYREFLYDNQSVSNNVYSFDYLNKVEKDKLLFLRQDSKFMSDNIYNLLPKSKIKEYNSLLSKTVCMYYINDYFDSWFECEEKVGLIATYKFEDFAYNFLEEIKIGKNVVLFKLQNESILGNLTSYNYSDYYSLVPKIGYSDEAYDDETTNFIYQNTFRLDLFNNETIHKRLNVIFFSIIMPYIETNSKFIFNSLGIDGKDKYLLSLNIFFYIAVTIVFLCYFFPIIKYVNTNIYKTKNMLSIIPLNILSSQNGVLKILNISHEK